MKLNNNEKIKNALAESNHYLYELSHEAGIGESTLYRWLRYPLNPRQKEVLSRALTKLNVKEATV